MLACTIVASSGHRQPLDCPAAARNQPALDQPKQLFGGALFAERVVQLGSQGENPSAPRPLLAVDLILGSVKGSLYVGQPHFELHAGVPRPRKTPAAKGLTCC